MECMNYLFSKPMAIILYKPMKSYDYWTHDIYLFHIKLMLTIYLTSQHP